MAKIRFGIVVGVFSLVLARTVLFAQAPQLLNYQGKLSTGGNPASSPLTITFSIYATATGTSALWSETQNVSVDKGIFNVLLGSVTLFPPNLFTGAGERFLSIKVGGDAEMTPRFRLTSVAFAIRANEADGVADGSISSNDIADGTIASIDIADGTIASADINDGTLTNTDVNANAAIAGIKISPDFGAQNIVTTGRIGLGITSPTAKLHISGTAGVDGIRFPDGSLQTTAATGGGFSLPFTQTISSASNAFAIKNNGGGGIGYFEIDHPTTTANTIFASTNSNRGGAAFFATYNANNSDATLYARNDGTGHSGYFDGKVYIKTNLGIGTTTPSAKLHIAGTPGADGIRFPDGSIQYFAATGGGGLTLPFSGSFAPTSDVAVFTIKNTGTIGDAAGFFIDNANNIGAAIYCDSKGNGGFGGVFNMSSALNNQSALRAATNSTIGYAADFFVNNTNINSVALHAATQSNAGYAAVFDGRVNVRGTLSKSAGSFKIDHPLDPANKYLSHSFVESPDMMNLYNGNARLDANGEAMVELPAWFEALNKDFRYQLTCVGGFAPVYIAEEIQGHRFKIAGGKPGLKISWQVTGVRKDAYANAHRIPVEEEKLAVERGHYVHPELYGQPEEKSLEWARNPEGMKAAKTARQPKVR